MDAGIRNVRLLTSVDDPLFPQVMELGDSWKKRVGFLPKAAFDAYAEHSTILVAEHQGQVLGYACYALPRLHVRLVHLCVPARVRGEGIARALVAEISSATESDTASARSVGSTRASTRCGAASGLPQ